MVMPFPNHATPFGEIVAISQQGSGPSSIHRSTGPLTDRTMSDLFECIAPLDPLKEIMAEGAVLLRGAALPFEKDLLAALNGITTISPFRKMVTPGGYTMSVAMTNCGAVGWVTNRTVYRYDCTDPETGNPWPPMPIAFSIWRS